MDVYIRNAQTADAPAISSLLRALGFFAKINAETPDATLEHVLRHLALCTSDDSHLILVACTPGGEIAGYCAAHWLPYLLLTGPEGYISELFIDEEFRGQGIGSQLLEAAKTEARSRGCCRLTLINLRKRESYQRRFYAKQGWEERAEAAVFAIQLDNPS